MATQTPQSGNTLPRSGSALRRLIMTWTAFLWLAPGWPAAGLAETETIAISKEYELKAAFLYNMAKFTEWPPQSFTAPNAPLIIGLLGRHDFGAELERIVKNHKIGEHPIEVRYAESLDEVQSCHVLFVSSADDARFATLQPALRRNPLLTVGESDEFVHSAGMIRFIVVGNKLRFEINSAAADRAELKLSAQLQKLATVIRRSP